MKKASEYRQHARDCRELAARMQTAEDREQMLSIAAHWDQLARDRADLIRNHPELAHPDEQAEEDALATTYDRAPQALGVRPGRDLN